MTHNNLTRAEAAERARLVSDVRYDVALDLTAGERVFGCDATVRFRATPGEGTFVDLVADAVHHLELNGRPLDVHHFDTDACRINLPGLAAENTLRVVADCRYEHTGVGLHRFVDPVDGEVYLHSQFEPFDAHRVYPCFDQPDLKAVFTLEVDAPEHWEVISNSAVESRAEGRWRFAPTPPVSPYITAVVAGPYHAEHDYYAGIDLGLYCRKSLAPHLEAGEVFTITRQGFEFFHRVFDYRYPFGKYDQLFVPEFNAGAMENAGCVTVSETYLFRSKVTDAERERRAETILHEMAHMWFGDLVTMRWWDDLWLNESFATYMSYAALVEATRFTDAWSGFSNGWKTWAYRQDQLPSTHPIVADIPDIDAVKVNFDGITYAKGAAVLRQLVAWVGEAAFLKGVAAYFRRHEWGNTTLADFLAVLEETSGRDLAAWSQEWLEQAGVNTLRPSLTVADDGLGAMFTDVAVEQEAPSMWPTLRSHRVGVGVFDIDNGRLVRKERIELDAVGARTPVPQLTGRRVPPLLLVNDGDLTYGKIRLDEHSLATLTERLGTIEDPLTRSLCWSAAWDMLRDAELPARRYLALVLANIEGETQISVAQSLLRQAWSAVMVFGDPVNRSIARQRLVDTVRRLMRHAEPGSDLQLAFASAFITAAGSQSDLADVRGLLDDTLVVRGLTVDTDLRWRIVKALAAAGAADEHLIAAEVERDPTDAGLRHAAAARAARPTTIAKADAWRAITEDRELPLATMEAIMGSFAGPDQEELIAPFVGPFFDALEPLWNERVPEVALSFAEAMYPAICAGDDLVDRTDRYLQSTSVPHPIRRLLLEGRDQVVRVLRTRACDAAAD